MVTNTIPLIDEARKMKKIKVLSVAPCSEAIRIHRDESVRPSGRKPGMDGSVNLKAGQHSTFSGR
jgi:hypothetical protein